MNKILSVFVTMLLFLTFAGCDERSLPGETAAGTVNVESRVPENANTTKTLVVYFSMPESNGADAVAGASRVVLDGRVYGNTQWIANRIQEITGAAEFAIDTVKRYPGDHETLVDQADSEKKNNVRPGLTASIENLDDYDVLFIGYPVWWADLPMPLYSFFEYHDLSGKVIIPFSSHGGSGFADTITTLSRLEPDAEVFENGFTVSRNYVKESGDDVAAWLDEMTFPGKNW